jgi:hypothetical protein
MSKIKQKKIGLTIENIEQQAVEQGVIEKEFNWKLVREGDSMTAQSKEVMWLEFGEDGRFKEKYDKPAIGRSLIMSPFNQFFTWQTTDIKEILEDRDGYVRFSTKNSIYILSKIDKK